MFDIKYSPIVYDNGKWIVVFHHNIEKTTAFDSFKDAQFHLEKNKYSILSNITENYKIDGKKFEFLLYYDELSISFHWKQTNNPIFEDETESTEANGFEYIGTLPSEYSTFGGLVTTTMGEPRNNVISSLLNGQPGIPNWFFAIGILDIDEIYLPNHLMPGPIATVKEVLLLLKVSYNGKFTCVKKPNHMKLILISIHSLFC